MNPPSFLPALVAGAPACIDKRFSVGNFWDRTRHYGASHVMTLGTMHLYLFQQPAVDNDADNPVRTMLHSPVIPQIVRPFMNRFGVELVWPGFGQSEVMGATSGYTDSELVETHLLDDNDQEVVLGATGEICIRGRHPFVLDDADSRSNTSPASSPACSWPPTALSWTSSSTRKS